jgi:hypothetical protein
VAPRWSELEPSGSVLYEECAASIAFMDLVPTSSVRRRAQLAGLNGEFSAHSLRSGFMTEAGRQNVPLAEEMALTGHRSVQTA